MKQLVMFSSVFALRIALGAEPDLPCQDANDPTGLSTLCGFAKPEDLQFVPSRSLIVVSEQGWDSPRSGGSISIVEVDTKTVRLGKRRTVWPAASATVSTQLIGDPQCKTPPAAVFAPHGLSVLEQRSGIRVAIMNHAEREAVELFDLLGQGDDLRLEWRGCVLLPPDTAGNDVAIHSDRRLFVTNYCPSVRDFRAVRALFAALRGENTGDVMEWSAKRGWRHLQNTAGAMPNGIVIDEARNRLFVAELGKQRVLEVKVLFDENMALHSVTSATDVGGGIVFGSTADQRIAIARWPQR